MICFKDRTFCNAKCSNTECSIKLTDQVFKDAAVWWGNNNAPVAMGDRSHGCTGYKPEGDNIG